MHQTLRSRQGCWTCRLRKKKCDEGRPQCETCKTLHITCHGYGPKPEWMDGSETERRAVQDLKQIVKQTSRRKKSSHPPLPRQAPRLAPRYPNRSAASPVSRDGSSSQRHELGPPTEQGSSPEAPRSDGAVHHCTPPQNPTAGFAAVMSAEDSSLLMHFMDNIFPLQYPVYNPDATQGGRGWLLSLLLGTKPLYHAALALGAYHRWLMIFTRADPECRIIATLRQEKHLEVCLKEVQSAMQTVNQFVQENRSDIGIGTVASVCQMVFLELFAGHDDAWRFHLNGAIEMYRIACIDDLVHLDLKERSRTILRENLPIATDGAVVTQEVATMRFMSGSLLWLDIIASITSGSAPRLQCLHQSTLSPDSLTKLEEIMGCRSSVLIQIGRIATLQSRNEESRRTGHMDCAIFNRAVDEIRGEVQYELSREALEGSSITGVSSLLDLRSDGSEQVSLVTRMFAYAALVYLHLTTLGFQRLELLDTIISGAIFLLRNRITPRLIPALVCPLYIIGCVARQGVEQELFRQVFLSPAFRNPLLKHRERILSAMEEIWRRSASATGCDSTWSETIQLHQDILLI